MAKSTAKGRSKGAFVMVHHYLLNSAAWLDLSGNAVKLLMHLMKLSSGNNGWGHGKGEPGELFLAERDAARAIGVSRNTVSKAFAELILHGLLRVVQAGHFQVKTRLATTWRLTFEPYPKAHQGPTNEWREFKPEQKTRAQKLNGTGAEIEPTRLSDAGTGSTIGPVKSQTGQNPPIDLGSKTAPHIDMPWAGSAPGPVALPSRGWWLAGRSLTAVARLSVAMMASTAEPATSLIPFRRASNCEQCNEPFAPAGRGQPKRFCSEHCRKRAETRRRNQRRAQA